MKNIYTVTQVNGYIKRMFSEDYALNNIMVKGELSNCKYHSSGHIYFTLKDAGAVLSGVMFLGNQKNGLKFRLKEGLKVVVNGSINIYERDGKYQIYAKEITLDGEGDLYREFERLKRELEEMGMFSSQYKKSVPKYVKSVGIVTAATGAAIQDICNIAKRRNPYVQLYLYSAKVQGEGSALSVADGIRALDSMNPDVIIVGRGGGSIEDLWSFNTEEVARAIFYCNTPVISAVGHETDTTIADFVADMRAPTPSAAAELAIFDIREVLSYIADFENRLYKYLCADFDYKKNIYEKLSLRLEHKNPENVINNKFQELDYIKERMQLILKRRLSEDEREFSILCERLNGLSPLNKLGKGYGFVTDNNKKPVLNIDDIKNGDNISIRIPDGRISAVVENIENLRTGEK